MKKLLISLYFLAFLAASCNKDNTDRTDTTVRQKLTNKTFRLKQAGQDANGNSVPDGTELKYTDSSTVFSFYLNDNGTGSFTFANKDTSGTATLSWTLDPSDTYITSTIPGFHSTVVSKIISITNISLYAIADTSANPKLFGYFEKE